MTLLDPTPATDEGLGALSTQPAAPEDQAVPRGRAGRGVLGTLRLGWRRLTSMRTALQLLFLLSLAAVPGGLLPQRGQEAARVTAYLHTHTTLGSFFDRLSLFDVFKAPWFAAIYVLLFVSLVGCLAPRIRLHARALRKPPPKTPARLSRLPSGSTTWTTSGSPEEVLAAAKPLLKGWRVAARSDAGGESLSAERGYARETGNLVFHVSLVVLLIGVAVGSLYGYEGDRVLSDGGSSADSANAFTNTRIQYDEYRPGGLVTDGSLDPWNIQLDSFVATYRADGSPADYVAHTTFTPSGGKPRPVDIKVNHPLMAGSGTKVYLLNHGYAPVFALKDAAGQTVQTSPPIICAPIESKNLFSRCELSFPGLPEQDNAPADLAFDIDFAPTGQLVNGSLVSTSPVITLPTFQVATYQGNLGHPANVNVLDYSGLKLLPDHTGAILPASGDAALRSFGNLPGGYSLSVVGIRQWASFQVKRDPAKKLVLLAAIGIVSGLLLSLRVRRRRLWIRAVAASTGPDPAPRRTVVEVGGLARSDQDAFRSEMQTLVSSLRGATGTSTPDSEEPR